MIKQIAIASIITLLLFGSSVLVFATPIPVFYCFNSRGRKSGYIAACIVALTGLIVALTGATEFGATGFVYLCYFLLTAVIAGEGTLRGWKLLKIGFWSVFAPWTMAMLLAFASQYVFGLPVLKEVTDYLSLVMQEIINMQEKAGALSPSQLAYLKSNANDLINFGLYTIPSFMWLFGMLVVAVTISVGRAFLARKRRFNYSAKFTLVKLPFWPVWLTIIAGLVFFTNAFLVKNTFVSYLAINVLIWSAGLYFLQGCLVVAFWLDRKKSPLLRLFIYGLFIFFLQVVGVVVILLGLSDQWVDFRKRSLTANNQG